MKLDNVNIGDTFFGIKELHSWNFVKGVRIVKCTVTKINKKTVGVTFDSESQKSPQLFPKNKDIVAISKNKKDVARAYLDWFLELRNYEAFTDRKGIIKYLENQLRRSE